MEALHIEELAQLSAAALVVLALIVVYFINKSKDMAMAAVLKTSVDTMTSTMKLSVDTLKESQSGQRLFYQAKVDELYKELADERQERTGETELLKKRITDLECEVKEKDERIASLENENAKLKAEVERLKGAMNGKADKAKKEKHNGK